MARLDQVIKQVDRVAREAAANVMERTPSPCGGCGRRKRKMVKSIRSGRSAGEIVKEILADLQGKE